MRLQVKIILLVCLLHNICKGQTYFNNYYTVDYTSLATTHIFNQSIDSSFVFFGFSKNIPGGRQDFTATRIDKYGSLLQNQHHNINNYDYSAFLDGYRQFIPATKSSYFGTAFTFASNTTTLILNKISRNTLDTVFSKFYQFTNLYLYLNNFIKFSDNKFLLCGNRDDNSGNRSPVILELDSNLTILNTYSVNTGTLNFSTTNAIYNPINKKLIFGGYKNITSDQVNLYFIESDTLGVVSNSLIINNNTVNVLEQLQYSYFDNSYVFCGLTRTSKVSGINYNRLQIAKLNSSGFNVMWNKTYGTGLQTNNLNSLLVNSDGSIVSCGRFCDSTYAFQVSSYDAGGVILKVNSVGDSLWMRQYNNYVSPPNPGNFFETLFGIEKTYDGGYIACGGIINQPQGKAWVIKMDSLGCVNAGCGGVISGTLSTGMMDNSLFMDGGVSIYPNPSNDVLHIDLVKADSFFKFKIINNLGEVIREEELKNNFINIKDLSTGIYFLHLISNKPATLSKKFVVSR